MEHWGTEKEILVYKDSDFIIVRHPTVKPLKYIYEVIPITTEYKRLDDIEICPEPSTLSEAITLMESNREWIREYKRKG